MTARVVVEYSRDMAVEAAILGGVLAKKGVKVEYRGREGKRLLVFRVNGHSYTMEKYPELVEDLLGTPQEPRPRA